VLREAAIFAIIGSLAIAFLVENPKPETYIGLVSGMLFYVAFVAVLAKFGYVRQSFRQARERSRAIARVPTASAQSGRNRPPPTRRTSTGPSQRPNRSNKKRRR
jgi:uncharacterized membrane protein YfcA